MIRFLVSILLAFFYLTTLVGCPRTPVTPEEIPVGRVLLTAVEPPTERSVSELNPRTGVYADDAVRIRWEPSPRGFRLSLVNTTAETMNIQWERAAFVDHEGQTGRVWQGELRLEGFGQAQADSVVPRGASFESMVLPRAALLVDREEARVSIAEIYPREADPQWHGRQMRIMLPLEIGAELNEYNFIFTYEHPRMAAVAGR